MNNLWDSSQGFNCIKESFQDDLFGMPGRNMPPNDLTGTQIHICCHIDKLSLMRQVSKISNQYCPWLYGATSFNEVWIRLGISSFISSLSHITHDNTAQLKNFFKRLVLIVILFILTPFILGYSIQFINLLSEKINAQNSSNFVSFITAYLNSDDFIKFLQSISGPFAPINFIFSPQSLMQLVIFLITIGFFLIGFLYIVFQFII